MLRGADKAQISVEGRGPLENLRLSRLLQNFMAEERSTGSIDGATVEDGVVLLRSHLRRSGFLQPRLDILLEKPGGEQVEIILTDQQLPNIPLDQRYKRILYRLDAGVRFYFESVEFEGLRFLKPDEARGYFYPQNDLMNFKSMRPYSPEIVRGAVFNLKEVYMNRGYREAAVEVSERNLDETTGAVTLQVGVNPGPLHLVAEVRETLGGSQPDSASQFLQPPQTLEKQAFTPEWQRRRLLETRLRFYEAGYPDTKVSFSSRVKNTSAEEAVFVDAQIRIEPGSRVRTGSITWEGLQFTDRKTAERKISLESGTWLSRTDLEESRRQLSSLGIFDSVRTKLVALEKAPGKDFEYRDIEFQVEESTRREYYVRAGYGSYERFRGGIEITQKNIFGQAHRSKVLLRASFKSRAADLQYIIPELWKTSWRWNASIDWLNREEVSFERDELTFQTGLDTFVKALEARTWVKYQVGRLESRNIDLDAIVGDESSRTGSLEFGILRDTLDNPIVPRDGYRIRASGEIAGGFLGSESQFQLYEFSYAYHREISSGWYFHGRFQHGVVFSLNNPDSAVPFNKRFFPGGENSIRGFREGEASFRNAQGIFIGASTISLASLEVERVLMGDLLLVGFWDGLLQGEREADYPGEEFLHSVGLGLRYNSPVGPFRVEYGYNLNPRLGDPQGTLHISLGFPF